MNHKCPKCSGKATERLEEIILLNDQSPRKTEQKFIECTKCEWTWATPEMRQYNASRYKRRRML